MSKKDLNAKLTELRKELIKHNAQIATGTTPKSPGQVKEVKKTIAKILTIVGTRRVSKLEEQKSSSVSTQKTEPKPEDKAKASEKEAPKNKPRKK